jgi:hypothetical protein
VDPLSVSFTVTDVNIQSKRISTKLSAAVGSFDTKVLQGGGWLSLLKRSNASVDCVVNASMLCQSFGSSVLLPRRIDGLAMLQAKITDGSLYTVEMPVVVRIMTPQLRTQPPSFSTLLRRSSSTNGNAVSLLLFNDGDIPLDVRVTFVSTPEFTVETAVNHVVVLEGGRFELIVSADFTGNVPDSYLVTIVLETNVPACDGSLLSVSVPWVIQVTDLLFVPPLAFLPVSPDDVTGISTQFSLANFAGYAASCVFGVTTSQEHGVAAIRLQQTVGVVDVGALFPVNVTVTYPSTRPLARDLTANITARCVAESGAVLGASASQLRIAWVSGAPSDQHSIAALATPSQFSRGTYVVVHVTLRDSSGNAVNANVDSALDVVGIRFSAANGVIVSGRIASIQLADDASGLVAVVPTHELRSGSFVLAVSVANSVIFTQGITVSQVACNAPLVLPDETAIECVCASGYYKRSDGCHPCPKGTFKRSVGNSTIFGCVVCPSDWYCVSGSSLPTARCPALGYSCSNGALSVLPGYSVTNFTDIPALIPDATPCSLYQACPYTDGRCAEGYTGDGCSQCLPGFTSFQSHCRECYSASMGAFLLVAWVIVVVACSAFTTTFTCEESGVTRFRQAFVGMWGGRFVALLRILQDVLTVCSLQLLIPTQVPSQHLTGFLSVIGAAVSPGVWPPTMCALANRTLLLLFPIVALLPIAAIATGISALLAPVVWKNVLHTPGSVLLRFWVSVRSLTWSFYPCVLWTLVKLEFYSLFAFMR